MNVARYLTDDWVIKQEVCQLMLLTKSLTGEEVARQIISVISTEMGISSDLVVGAMHDRASVNKVAMRTVKVIYQNLLDVGCFSHTLDRVGEYMKTPILDEFLRRGWVCLHVALRLVLDGGHLLLCRHPLTQQQDGGAVTRCWQS